MRIRKLQISHVNKYQQLTNRLMVINNNNDNEGKIKYVNDQRNGQLV